MIIQTWQIWLALAIVLAALELMGFQFIMLALAVSALVVMLATVFFAPDLTAQLWIFALAALVLTPAFILWFRRYFQGQHNRTGVVGERGHHQRQAQVVRHGQGLAVVVDGNHFPVQYRDGTAPPEGVTVQILHFEGITAIVASSGESQ